MSNYLLATEKAAKQTFPETEVEKCECCGFWSASQADADNGQIIGPCVVHDETLFDRICLSCDALDEEELKREYQQIVNSNKEDALTMAGENRWAAKQ